MNRVLDLDNHCIRSSEYNNTVIPASDECITDKQSYVCVSASTYNNNNNFSFNYKSSIVISSIVIVFCTLIISVILLHNGYPQYVYHNMAASSTNIRDEIYDLIANHPGIRYRELLRLVRISNGGLTYHLGILERFGLIKVNRQSNNRVTRYFVANISNRESSIISCIRCNVLRNIVLFVLKNEYCTFDEITDNLGKSRSTTYKHIKRLTDMEILGVSRGSGRLFYKVTNKARVERVLLMYKMTFTKGVSPDLIDKL